MAELMRRHDVDGMSYRELAASSGIKAPTLYGWIQRLRREASAGGAVRIAAGFVELAAASRSTPIPCDSGIELVLASGMRVQLASSFDGATLKRLLLLLSA